MEAVACDQTGRYENTYSFPKAAQEISTMSQQ